MEHLNRLIERLTVWIGSLILILMVIQIVVDVSMRTLLGAGLPATSELVSNYYMVLVSFLPIAYSEVRRRHVEATIFTDHLRPKLKLVVELLGFILATIVFTLLFWGTLVEAIAQTGKGAYVESGVTMFYTWPSYWVLPVSFGLMVLVLVFRVIATVTELASGHNDDHINDPDMISVTLAEESK